MVDVFILVVEVLANKRDAYGLIQLLLPFKHLNIQI